MGIISHYYAKELVGSPDIDERLKNVSKVTKEDIVNIMKKIKIHSVYILEDNDEKDNDKDS